MWCKWGLHLTQFVTDFGVCRYLSMSEWIWLSQYNYWASNRMFILLSWESFLPAKFPMGKTIEHVEMCWLFHTHVWIQGIIPLSTTTTNFVRYYLKNLIAYWIWTKSKAPRIPHMLEYRTKDINSLCMHRCRLPVSVSYRHMNRSDDAGD